MKICDRCDNPATVHLTEIRAGKKTERHLCENCARALHVPSPGKELQKLLKTFQSEGSAAREIISDPGRSCPECGMTWTEFRQHGRFGCANDYVVFADEVERLLKRIHGGTRYSGKTPSGGVVEDGHLMDERAKARKALQEAIEDENYEEAARIRDQIHRLDVGAPGHEPGSEPGAEA